ncbi:RNA helicase [Rothia sp. ZJ932]|uniref:DEAD/DEAH box helicase n=1 Tax=Rothia sp. ZJ932 TaxID=2810516 RepID=UPI0019679C89|nr:DEAD/DEAH box helicase [Rothia sp. ZJ932]QRZ60744.1 DEAD/DEAH box helicase [Rothia sp. ZJ932]
MSIYAERYRHAKERAAHSKTQLGIFESQLGFELDTFQKEACRSVEAGRGVLVAAPTGAGKTIVGEFAIHCALAQGKKAFYTTPIKALSNQKYNDLVEQYGEDAVGLLTGDTSINSEAPVVVMTTEVLRNMLYADSSTLNNLAFVVMDEVHYLADRFRGAVWEEVIIHLPEHISIISLSATVSNVEEFGAWLDTVRGSTDVIVSEHRPVPLWQHVLAGKRLVDLFAEETTVGEAADALSNKSDDAPAVNPELLKMRTHRGRPSRARPRAPHQRGRRRGPRDRRGAALNTSVSGFSSPPSMPARISRPAMIETLDANGLLPAICFIFSRAGCDGAVSQCIDADIRLTTEAQAQTIRAYIAEATASLDVRDLKVLGFYEWREGLTRGVAAHHAGLLPVFKEIVETLFSEGLIKVVFATETLALGINMPARSVVLEKLTKFNGENHVDITPGEYTQLTGRAGRRGIDVEGHAVVMWRPGMQAEQVAGLASRRTYPLNSSFRPTYNMSANLIAQFGAERTRKILESSFAQFQADKSVVGIAQRVRKNERALEGYTASMECHLGDFTDYARLRRDIKELEKSVEKSRKKLSLSQSIASLQQLVPGDVIEIPRGKNRGEAVVLTRAESNDDPRPSILTIDAHIRRLDVRDLVGPIVPVSKIKVPKKWQGKTPKERRDMASRMREALYKNIPPRERAQNTWFDHKESPDYAKLEQMRQALRQHPCHGCSEREDHARWAERWWKLDRETDGLRRQISRRTNTISQVFNRITDLLASYGYVEQGEDGSVSLTPQGRSLRRIYGEKDLLTSLCLEKGFMDALDSASAAAVVSAVVYQGKRDDGGLLSRYPRPDIESSITTLITQWSKLNDAEQRFKLPQTPAPDLGMVWPVYKWARGDSLSKALEGTDLAAGDFVRWIKQVIDSLDQIAHVSQQDPHLRTLCEASIGLIKRGVVADQM